MPMARKRHPRTLWRVLLVVLLLGCAAAQGVDGPSWTVQTVALRDLREADGEVARLTRLGLPAYVTFTMVEGLQYVRVRVGCFDAREGATALADLLVGRVVGEALVVPIEQQLPENIPCVRFDVGFRIDTPWSVVSARGEAALFRLEVGAQVAYLRYELERWRLWQSNAPEPIPQLSSAAELGLRSVRIGGERVVQGVRGLLCPGELISVAGDTAMVAVGDAVVACRWEPAP
jgi:hypothetical protein